jgi:hypothetical protein
VLTWCCTCCSLSCTGHLAKYQLRVYVHSLNKYKDKGDRRAELLALLTGLHHPEIYSKQLSRTFMRLIRGMFPDKKSISVCLSKYDKKNQKSRCFVPRKRVWQGLLGGPPKKSKSWSCSALLHLASAKDIKVGLVERVQQLEVKCNDIQELIDIDDVRLCLPNP